MRVASHLVVVEVLSEFVKACSCGRWLYDYLGMVLSFVLGNYLGDNSRSGGCFFLTEHIDLSLRSKSNFSIGFVGIAVHVFLSY